MNPMQSRFDVEILDDQRQLNGTRHVSLEGAGKDANGATVTGWTVSLNYVQRKDSAIDEADLTLVGPDGCIFAGLESGQTDIVTDDVGGDERELIDLTLQIAGGEGQYAEASGEIHLEGDLQAVGGQLELSVSFSEPS